MRRLSGFSALLLLLLDACAALPPGPSVMALPGQGKTFELFQQDDSVCRQFASAQIGNLSPSDAANQSFVGSSVIGTVLGAAAGAAIGAATGGAAAGAAIGAASGLLLGSTAGFATAGYSGAALQARYDMGYLQCMSAKGEHVPTATASAGVYPYLYPYSYVYSYSYVDPHSYVYPYSNYYYGIPHYRSSYWGRPIAYFSPPATDASLVLVGPGHGGHY